MDFGCENDLFLTEFFVNVILDHAPNAWRENQNKKLQRGGHHGQFNYFA